MEYTVQKMAELAGVSARTLRYYDQIGLLKPARINDAAYRLYGEREVDLLQQILFYRELEFSLEDIRTILSDPGFDRQQALEAHKNMLMEKSRRLDRIIRTVERTIGAMKGEETMSDKEKFEGFKRELIEKNEAQYGEEIREKYGDETVNASNAKLMGMSEEQYEQVQALEREIRETLRAAKAQNDPAGPLARKACEAHKRWIQFFWPSYSKEAHMGLAEMYVQDERFRAYYDSEETGTAEFLRDAMRVFLEE